MSKFKVGDIVQVKGAYENSLTGGKVRKVREVDDGGTGYWVQWPTLPIGTPWYYLADELQNEWWKE